MRRRMLSLLLAIVMVLGMLPVTALAAEQPFLSISVNGTDLSTDKILFKTLFDLGSLESSYSYVHEDVPYYHVTVPCGTEYVDVTYSADTNIFDSGSDAYGYATELEVDAVSSATVKGRTFKDAYTLNDDGTQTVKTPVKGYTFDENGNGMAITLEEEGGTYEAVCLFTFEYDGENHVYTSSVTAPTCQTQGYTTYTCTCGDSYASDYVDIGSHSYENGVCSVCGAEDPDYVVHTHSYTTVVTAPTCTEKGYTTYTCECGDTYTSDETSALGHSYVAGLCSTCGEADPAYVAPTVTAFFSVSHDDTFRDDCASGDVMALKEIIVPYFDLALYGLEDFYFSSEEYGDDGDNLPGSDLLPGTAEYADGKVTMLHLFIYATEVCYLGVDPADAGQGYLYDQGILGTEVLNISGSVGSSFLNNFWNQDLNLNYYLNYEYPLASEGWGSTSDQILLHDGDIVTVGHFTDWSFFNDSTSIFNYIVADNGTIAQGDEINLTLYHAGADMSGSYTTAHTVIDYCPDVYYAPIDAIPSGNVTEWTYLGTAESDGTLSVNTADMAPGEYIIALAGQYGAESTEAICSTPGGVIITVEEAVSTVSPVQIDGVYQIGTAEELVWLAETVNGGETAISAVLTANIDLTGIEWPGIGTSSAKFAGSFDGQNQTVTLNGGTWGLFGYTAGTSSAYAQIKNVITDGTVKNSAIAHDVIYTNVENCINRAYVTGGNAKVAGIVGSVNTNGWQGLSGATITNCINEGSIAGGDNVGGILGYSQVNTQITGCSNTGSISGTTDVGGIAGYLQEYKETTLVNNCYNTGKVTGSGNDQVAGLVGNLYNGVSVENCYNAGETYYAVAGNVYNNTSSVSNTYYLDSASTEAVPESSLYDSVVVASKSHEEMRADDFVTTLGDAYQANCPYPVLTWQTAAAHDYVKGVCSVCAAEDPNYVPDANEPAQVDGVYQIGTAAELNWFAAHVNEGNTSASAVLTADIDLDNASWTSIGVNDYRFAGSFDGQGHKITNLFGTNGLFGYAKGAEDAYAVIKNVTVDGTITAAGKYVAGIVGDTKYVTVENCVNLADISSTYEYVGGVIGYAANTTITGCGNEGAISGAAHTAGIVGYNSNASVTANCWNLGDISSTGNYVGGIAGRNVSDGSSVTDCYNRGAVSGKNNIGGVIGYNQKHMADCYNWGAVIGQNSVGGISGYNTGSSASYVGMENCYNAGLVFGNERVGGATGFQSTGLVSNSYYLEGTAVGDTSDYVDGAYVPVDIDGITVVTADTMKSADFASTMGEAYKQGSLYPILSWQEAEAASACAVTIPEETGYTVMGPKLAIAGEDYRFSVTVTEGYMEGENFAVQVNGKTVTAVNGVYTVENVNAALNIVVTGVELEPAAIFTVTLPETGNGYAVVSVDGFNADSVTAKEDYKFTVSFANGFRAGEDFAVKANDVELTADENGIYTIEAVASNQTITVSGVEMIPSEESADIRLTITKGENRFYTAEATGTTILDLELTVPYFDIALYGLEDYYYNPNCYVDENGNAVTQTAGNPETAYGNITLIHTFIYTTEVYYLGMDEADAGKGISKTMDTNKDGISDFDEVLSWTGGVGSSFMDLWDHGTNLNYYLNYTYPLGREGWGLTSDQQLLVDGDVVSMHLIEDKLVSGSNFAVFTANDADKTFSKTEDQFDRGTVTQGETIALTLYQTQNGSNYTTDYRTVAGQELYWVNADEVSEYVSDWNRTAFGAMEEGSLVTDSTGTITIDTTGLESGTYYIGALGGLTEGGSVDNAGFVSRGGETGAAFFELTVLEGEETELLLGDLTGDGNITATDAAMVYRYINNTVTINQMQITAADVNEDGEVTATDAAMIYRYINNTLNAFSDEE